MGVEWYILTNLMNEPEVNESAEASVEESVASGTGSAAPEAASASEAKAPESEPPADDVVMLDVSSTAPPPPTDAELALQAERDKYRDQLLRKAADFDNFRKRARRDMEEEKKRTRDLTIREFLPLIDNLHRALAAAGTASDVQAVVEGVQMVVRGFDDIAKRFGLEQVPGVGEPFDPNVHDAIQQAPTNEHPPGTIVSEVQSGYTVEGRLLRAAMVVVATAAPEEDAAADASQSEE